MIYFIYYITYYIMICFGMVNDYPQINWNTRMKFLAHICVCSKLHNIVRYGKTTSVNTIS